MTIKLEKLFHELLQVNPNRSVIAVSNGAIGLQILAGVIDLYDNKKMTYITSENFYSDKQH
jgi:hypothetical protein